MVSSLDGEAGFQEEVATSLRAAIADVLRDNARGFPYGLHEQAD